MAARLPFFFFGTLMDRDLLERVAGQPVSARQIEPAAIAGYRRTGVIGRAYPILVRSTGSRTAGIVVHGLDGRAARRLDAYEGSNYRLTPVTVTQANGRAIEAVVYLFRDERKSDRRLWRLADWQRRWKRRALRRAARLKTPPKGI